jgi:hypothetical protein
LLAQGLWFYPASSTTKTGCHDIAGSSVKKTKIKSTNLNQNTLFVTINIDSTPPPPPKNPVEFATLLQ